MTDLGTLGGTFGVIGGAYALNNRGQVVGQSNLSGDTLFHPFLWTAPGPMRDLGTLGGPTGTANAINEAGEIVGFADTAPGASTLTDAFLWQDGTMTDLGTLAGDCFSGAFGINAWSQVVGQSISCDFTVFRAFLWEKGQIIDLNVFVPAGSDFTLTDVETINDRGEMFGIGTLANGNDRAFLLIPCDENHPNIEGCDYSMVDAIAELPVARPPATEASRPLPPAALWRRNARFHFPALGPKN